MWGPVLFITDLRKDIKKKENTLNIKYTVNELHSHPEFFSHQDLPNIVCSTSQISLKCIYSLCSVATLMQSLIYQMASLPLVLAFSSPCTWRKPERFLNSLSSNSSFVLFLIYFRIPYLDIRHTSITKMIEFCILLEIYQLTVLQYLNPLKSTGLFLLTYSLAYSSVSSPVANTILCVDSFSCKHLLSTYGIIP